MTENGPARERFGFNIPTNCTLDPHRFDAAVNPPTRRKTTTRPINQRG